MKEDGYLHETVRMIGFAFGIDNLLAAIERALAARANNRG